MKYRAQLIDPSATRETKPQQAFSNSAAELEEWAIQTLSANQIQGSEVHIFKTIEQHHRLVTLDQAKLTIQQRIDANAAALSATEHAKRVGIPPEKQA